MPSAHARSSHRRKLWAFRAQLQQLDGQVGALAAGVAGVTGLLHAAAADVADLTDALQHGQDELGILWATVNAIAEHLNGPPPPPPPPPQQLQLQQQVQAQEQEQDLQGWEQLQLHEVEEQGQAVAGEEGVVVQFVDEV